MRKITKNDLRNCVHYIGGFTLVYAVLHHSNILDGYLWQIIILYLALGSLMAGLAGWAWEWAMEIILKEPSDFEDVVRTAIGGFLGGITAAIFPNITIISRWLLLACIIAAILDIIRAIINYYKNKTK